MPLLANYCRKNTSRSRREHGPENICSCDRTNSDSDLGVSSNPNTDNHEKPKIRYDLGVSSNPNTDNHERPKIKYEVGFSNSTNNNNNNNEKSKFKYDGMGLVKTFLGPSLEDAFLKTVEFGKTLIQKCDENEIQENPSPKSRRSHKEKMKNHMEKCLEHGVKTRSCATKNYSESRSGRKRIVFTAQLEKNMPLIRKPPRKMSHVSKIRSLDSDLKTTPHSPEKIKKQLEALIQINKDEPPENPRLSNWDILAKIPRVPVEMTIMPSVCIYKNDVDLNSSSCEGQSPGRSTGEQSSSVRNERRPRTRLGAPSGICQAPEFISNALGPTLDVSIIDNLKMMRNIFKTGESGRGEGSPTPALPEPSKPSSGFSVIDSGISKHTNSRQPHPSPPPQPSKQPSEDSTQGKSREAEKMEKMVAELQQKYYFLQRQIEMEEKERAFRRVAFEEEEKKMTEMKACLENLARQMSTRECSTQKSQFDINYEGKHEAIKQRVAHEEEKLSRLRDQYECWRRELSVVKTKADTIQRNKCILDAWDVIASRVCHTRLPSFTRAHTLERKQSSVSPANLHCCFPSPPNGDEECETPRISNPKKCKSQNNAVMFAPKNEDTIRGDSFTNIKACLMAQGEIPYPIQRDITCGLHQTLRTCTCKASSGGGGAGGTGDCVSYSSDDEMMKKRGNIQQECKPATRSKSDTAVKRDRNSKIIKVLWAVTRINIFQDNCRTYEVMDASSTPPSKVPAKTEGIFVVRNSQRRGCQKSGSRKRCILNFSAK